VIGLGYVGLPLAVEASRAGLTVTGFDTNRAVINGLNSARSHSHAQVLLDTGGASHGGHRL
jgi:UDP-N-acetyl-D-mannosaminuronate dehydrogenase